MARNTRGLKRTAGPGRPKGSQNTATKEFKAFWLEFYESTAYRASAKARILKGKAPHLESYTLAKLFGKPVDEHVVTGADGGPVLVRFVDAK